MSAQFGRWNFEGQPPAPDYVEKVSATLAPYGPDSDESYAKCGVQILYRSFRTTEESQRETQPHISPSGAVITWDGRLDNRAELISELRDSLTTAPTDVAIVTEAYEKWGANSFAKLIGDWALSIWNPINRSLILAKDPIGTRHLYYSIEKHQMTWSTILDPLVLFAGKTFAICEEYIAGWFSMFPAAHLTPYVGLHAVPPSSSVFLRPGSHTVNKYWDFDPAKKIRYRTDLEYEEHFRIVFAKAVQRRLRSDRPILAELSGGMDSSSIVCMADTVIARGVAETPCLDTISWYDDSYDHIEPDWNERPYFSKVEEKRGRTGCHIDLAAQKQRDVGSQRSFQSEFESDRFAATPVSNRHLSWLSQRYAAYMMSQGHRVVLSGIGGSEFLGDGVPTPKSEFQNLLARARFVTLIRQLNAWAIKMRKPRLPLLWEALQGFFSRAGAPNVPPWFRSSFVRRNRAALCGYPSRVKLFGPLPSFQSNMDTLECIRRLQTLCGTPSELFQDVRYPYLDQNLLEFVFAIPREQLVRVGQRRFLMKRALVGIVPDAILNRKRKAFVPQEPSENNPDEWDRLIEMGPHMVSSPVGIIDPDRFWEAVQKAQRNEEVPMHILKRTLTLEAWLRHLAIHGVLTNSMLERRQEYSCDSEHLPRASKGSQGPCLSARSTRRESLLGRSEDKELQAPSPRV